MSSKAHDHYLDICFDEAVVACRRVTDFYGEPSRDCMHTTWEYIQDLNKIAYGTEKEGVALHPQR